MTEISQAEISKVISELFLSNESHKKNKPFYLSQLKNSSLNSFPLLIQTLKYLFSTPSTKPEIRLLALHFVKEATDLNSQPFLQSLKKSLYPLFFEDAKFQKENKDDDRGKFFFSMKPDANTKIRGNSYLRLLLECIEVWAKWYKNDAVLAKGYRDLLQLGVKFPSEKTYFKNINEEMKVPIDNEQAEESDNESIDNESIGMELTEIKKKLKAVLYLKDVNSQEIKEIFGKFKVYRDKIELLTLKKKGNKALDEEKKFIETLFNSYKYSIKNSEKNFETLKEKFFLLIGESPPPKPKLIVPHLESIQIMTPNSRSPDKKSKIMVDLQLIRSELLSSREFFNENLGKHLKIIKENPHVLESLLSFLICLLQDSTEKAISRYLSLSLINSIMTLNDNQFIQLISKMALPKVIEIAKFNFRSKASDKYCSFFGETMNENIEKLAEEMVLLAIECIYIWAKHHPSEPSGNSSEFLENYQYLKELGVNFSMFEMVNSEELGDEFDEKFLELHIKEVNNQIEELKIFLTKTKKTIKDPNFLPNMLEILINEEKTLKKVPLTTSNVKEAQAFIKEFRKRFRKLENGMINYTQFKKRFLKFLGLSEGFSSKISSKLSTSDITGEKPNTVNNKNQDLVEKQEIFQKIPQKTIEKQIDILEEDIFAEFSKTALMSQDTIDSYFELVKKNSTRNLEILVSCAKTVFEDSEAHYMEKFNYLNLLRKCIDSSEMRIIQYIHDYLMRSLILAIFQANFSNQVAVDRIQEDFRFLALESLRDWGLRYKQNVSLINFKKCWNLLVEELMIEVPEKFLEKSSVFLDQRRKPNKILGEHRENEKDEERSQRFYENEKNEEKSIRINENGMMKKNVESPQIGFKSKPKISFGILFNEEKEKKMPLKGFVNEKTIGNHHVNRPFFFKNEEKLRFEAKLIKENIDLKKQLQMKEVNKMILEKELKTLKEKLKIYEKVKF